MTAAHTKTPWTKDDERFLRKNYHRGAKLCANILNRRLNTVYNHAQRMGLTGTFYTKFSKEDLQFIQDNMSTMSFREIGEHIGRSFESVRYQVRKRRFFRSAEDAHAIKMRCVSVAWFPAGHAPHNTRSDFEISIRKESGSDISYKHIRVALGKWVMLHVYEWEKLYGPVPNGMILRCKSDDRLNCSPDNWEPVDRARHLALNNGSETLEDRYITNIICKKNKHLKPIVAQMPELIELKRNQLKLQKTINELT